MDHDISLLVPEVWCRMSPQERDPRFLIEQGHLEKCENLEFNGQPVLAARLGYRITQRFVHAFFGRVFNHPGAVFTEEMLRPELQDIAVFADGLDNIVSTQRHIASLYFDDGSVEQACPPLHALLHIMRQETWQGKGLEHPDVRHLFTREYLLGSDWYAARLKARQAVEGRLWQRHIRYLERFLSKPNYTEEAGRLGIDDRLQRARQELAGAESPTRLAQLVGTLGAEPIERFRKAG
jgi:hypothetical protein